MWGSSRDSIQSRLSRGLSGFLMLCRSRFSTLSLRSPFQHLSEFNSGPSWPRKPSQRPLESNKSTRTFRNLLGLGTNFSRPDQLTSTGEEAGATRLTREDHRHGTIRRR